PLGDILIGYFRLVIRDGEVFVLLQLELGRDLELGGEFQGLALIELDLRNIGPAHDVQILLFHALFQKARNEVFEDLLADAALELLADQTGRRFARTEARQLGLGLERGDHLASLALHFFYWDRNV